MTEDRPQHVHGGRAYDELGALYDAWCSSVTEDVPFYLGLAEALADELDQPRLRIVELGAGSGRVTLPLAAAGHAIDAVDASSVQLRRLAERAAAQGYDSEIRCLHGDMRELAGLDIAGGADLVIAPFRSLLHVARDRDQVLAGVHSLLQARGALAFDVYHLTGTIRQRARGRLVRRGSTPTVAGRWRFAERATFVPADDGPGADECPGADTPAVDLELEVHCSWRPARSAHEPALPDPAPGEPATRVVHMHLHAPPAAAWRQSLEAAGFAVDGAYGWFDGRPWRSDDEDSAWVARPAPAGGDVGHDGGRTPPPGR